MGVLASKGVRRVWALLLDGTYRTNRTYVMSLAANAGPKRAS